MNKKYSTAHIIYNDINLEQTLPEITMNESLLTTNNDYTNTSNSDKIDQLTSNVYFNDPNLEQTMCDTTFNKSNMNNYTKTSVDSYNLHHSVLINDLNLTQTPNKTTLIKKSVLVANDDLKKREDNQSCIISKDCNLEQTLMETTLKHNDSLKQNLSTSSNLELNLSDDTLKKNNTSFGESHCNVKQKISNFFVKDCNLEQTLMETTTCENTLLSLNKDKSFHDTKNNSNSMTPKNLCLQKNNNNCSLKNKISNNDKEAKNFENSDLLLKFNSEQYFVQDCNLEQTLMETTTSENTPINLNKDKSFNDAKNNSNSMTSKNLSLQKNNINCSLINKISNNDKEAKNFENSNLLLKFNSEQYFVKDCNLEQTMMETSINNSTNIADDNIFKTLNIRKSSLLKTPLENKNQNIQSESFQNNCRILIDKNDNNKTEITNNEKKLDLILYDNLMSENCKLKGVNEKLVEEIKNYEYKLQSQKFIEETNESLLTELKKLQENVQASSNLIAKKDEELQLVKDNLNERNLKIKEFECKLANEIKKFERENNIRVDIEKQHDILNIKLNNLRKEFDEVSTFSKNCETRLQATEEQLAKRHIEFEDMKTNFEKKLQICEKEFVSYANKKCESTINELNNLKSELEIALDLIAKRERESDLLRSQRDNLEQLLITESEEFDEIENNLRMENFDLKQQVIKYKLRLNLITEEEANMELGFDISKIYKS